MSKVYPVLLAGGSGTRLWPLSRKSYPKQFSKLIGEMTLFQSSAKRLTSSHILEFAPQITLTNSDFRFIIGEQLQEIGIDPSQILIEPETRNTAAAILAASIFAHSRDENAVLLVAPSDHVIPETHLIPLILDAIDGKRENITIFWTDYETPDGTCIRDYVHVCDLVDAHVLGLKWLENGGSKKVFNLGTKVGFSVREVIEHAGIVTNRHVPVLENDRREGDCTNLVSSSELARTELGWEPKRSTLKHMITDAWRWHQKPGYQQ